MTDMLVRITSEFEMVSPWDDLAMQFVGQAKYKPLLHELFEDDAWKTVMLKPSLVALADSVKQDFDKTSSPSKAGTVLTSADTKKKEHLKTLARARVPASKLRVPVKL